MKNYDQIHELWAKAHSAGSPMKYVRNLIVFQELSRLQAGNTLDVGCGTGEYSIFLSKCGHSVTAFDPSTLALKELLELGGQELGIIVEQNTVEKFSSNSAFDNIISIEVFEHLASDDFAIKKCCSLLKEGGSLVISVPACPFLFSEADKISGHYRRYTYFDLIKLLSNAGLKDIRIRRYGFPVLFLYSLARKIFLDKILIRYFTFSSSNLKKSTASLTRLYPYIFLLDEMDTHLLSVGYIASGKK